MLSEKKQRENRSAYIHVLAKTTLTTLQPKFAIGELVPLTEQYDTEIEGDSIHHTGLIRGVCFEEESFINGNSWVYSVYPPIHHPLHDDILTISEFELTCLIKERSGYLERVIPKIIKNN